MIHNAVSHDAVAEFRLFGWICGRFTNMPPVQTAACRPEVGMAVVRPFGFYNHRVQANSPDMPPALQKVGGLIPVFCHASVCDDSAEFGLPVWAPTIPAVSYL